MAAIALGKVKKKRRRVQLSSTTTAAAATRGKKLPARLPNIKAKVVRPRLAAVGAAAAFLRYYEALGRAVAGSCRGRRHGDGEAAAGAGEGLIFAHGGDCCIAAATAAEYIVVGGGWGGGGHSVDRLGSCQALG